MSEPERVRADLWLWAARFFKTRRLAREAIDGGKVMLNGVRCKPASAIKQGDVLVVTRSKERYEVAVQALSVKRGSAAVAQTLYEESAASRATRERIRELNRLSRPVQPAQSPEKAARRRLRKLKREQH